MDSLDIILAVFAVLAFVGLQILQQTTVDHVPCTHGDGFGDIEHCYESWRSDHGLHEMVAVSTTESRTQFGTDRWLVVWSRPVHSLWAFLLLLVVAVRKLLPERPKGKTGEVPRAD